MARKRRKSRSKKQRKAKNASHATSTDAPNADGDGAVSSDETVDEASVVAIDDEDETSIAAALSAVVALDEKDAADVVAAGPEETEPELLTIDEDDEPHVISLVDGATGLSVDGEQEDRERLITEAVAFRAAEEAGIDQQLGQDAEEDEVDIVQLGGDEDTPRGHDANPIERSVTSARPSLSRDAVAALTEMQAQGLIELPNDLVFDLGEATTDDERDRLLAAALAHVEMQEARFRVPTAVGRKRSWKGTAATGLVMLALLVAVAPPAILVPDPPAQLTESDLTYGVIVALILQAQQVDAFRAREQRLPGSLEDVGTVLPDIRYVKSSNRLYQLVAYTSDGIAVVYDSASPAAIFERVAQTWVTTQEGA